MEVASAEEAQDTFNCLGETYVMLMYGRINPRDALAEGRVSAVGDRLLVQTFGGHFVGS